MSTYKFAMEGSTGKTTRYEAYLKDGKLVDVTKLGAKEIRMSFSYGQRLYTAAKKGMFSLSHARGHEEDIKSDVIRKRYRGRGQPKKPSVKHAKQSRQSKTSSKTWAVKRAIGIALKCYHAGTGWDYGGYKQASEVYRMFRDVYDGDVQSYSITDASPIAPLSMCEGRAAIPHKFSPYTSIYAWLCEDDSVSGSDDGIESTVFYPFVIPNVSWVDMCNLKYTFGELQEIVYKQPRIVKKENNNIPVFVAGFRGYDYGKKH